MRIAELGLLLKEEEEKVAACGTKIASMKVFVGPGSPFYLMFLARRPPPVYAHPNLGVSLCRCKADLVITRTARRVVTEIFAVATGLPARECRAL